MSRRSLALAAGLAAIVLLVRAPASGQAATAAVKPKASSGAWTPPRTSDGKPDLQGVWSSATLTPLERSKGLGAKEFYTDEEFSELLKRARQGEFGPEADIGRAAPQAVRFDLSLYGLDLTKVGFASSKRTSLIVGPEGSVPPMLPEARKRNAERAARLKGHEYDSYRERPLAERCVVMPQERIPLETGPDADQNLLQIVQGTGYVALLHEQNHQTRIIPTDGRTHIPQNIRQYQGDSVGHWEGDTLVIDTTNFTDLTPFRGSGPKLHVVERFTPTGDGAIMYRFTVEDPETWDRPWTAEVPMRKATGPVYEWACHEGNTMITTILSGARLAEQDAAQKAAAK